MSFTCEKVETLTEGGTKCVLGVAIAFSRQCPDLVCVVVGARPYLHDGAVVLGAIGEIETFTLVGPSDSIIGRDGELLVCISRSAGVNLHFVPVGSAPISDV